MACHYLYKHGQFLGVVCEGREKRQFCACGRVSDLLCDWKVKTKKSGTCDAPICRQCALEVGPDKHLCKAHQKAYAEWKKRNPGAIPPPDYSQLSLL